MWSKIWYPPDRNGFNKIFKRTEDNLPKPIPELQRTDISFEKFPPQSKQVNLFTSISPLSLESALSLSMNMMSSSIGIKLSLWGSKISSCLTTLGLFFKLSLVFLLIGKTNQGGNQNKRRTFLPQFHCEPFFSDDTVSN